MEVKKLRSFVATLFASTAVSVRTQMKHTLALSYVPGAFTEKEGELTVFEKIDYLKSEESNVQTVRHTEVKLPNDEVVEVVAELTDYGNTFTVRQEKNRLCSVRANAHLNVMFRTIGGLEVYAETSEL